MLIAVSSFAWHTERHGYRRLSLFLSLSTISLFLSTVSVSITHTDSREEKDRCEV